MLAVTFFHPIIYLSDVDSHEYTRISITKNKDHLSVQKIKERMTDGFAEVSIVIKYKKLFNI